ncbi:hypothetical protein SAMN02745126_04552 [Enhydrobacter aerosaccus]|uniref:Copper resistance protein D n=1 Tax=Enhydrobacter aerosaccus TaxID=225324 RepID=A0A1T4SCN6_9HYPH|nr:hypothetical protein [Enhydrobacter aerosaccus]SKA25621.1 hypothetical protein SAMN02745126_04552 [Enhydrobacter aerosaccus]
MTTAPHALEVLRIPTSVLVAFDWRPFHFVLQPVHHLVRMAHIVTVSGFYGAIGLLDLRLMGWNDALPLRALAERTLPILRGLFVAAVITGVGLFLYEPVKVGSHAYFTPKLILIVLGMANAGLFHLGNFKSALAAETIGRHARLAGGASLLFWTMVIVFACLNTEAAPKMLLR